MARSDGRGRDRGDELTTNAMRNRGTAPTVRAEDTAEIEVAAGATFGRFVTQEPLGRGGMGVVIAAHDPELNRRVAIKVLHSGVWGADDTVNRTRLQREAQAMAQLAHPNVVAVYEVGTTDDLSFIAMELVEGQTLRAWQREGRPWRETLDMYVAAGRGLAAAHGAGLVHRDFKPENVLVGRDGRPRVTDFGLVASSDTPPDDADADADTGQSGRLLTAGETVRGVALGTPHYMSPEHWEGTAVDARSDQFSFCMALWEALYGERPFRAAGDGLRAAVCEGQIAQPSRSRGVPSRVEAALRRGMHPDPTARWPALDPLLDALESHAAARRIGPIAIAVGALAAAIIAGTVVLVMRSRSSPSSAAAEIDAGRPAPAAPFANVARGTARLTLADSCEEYPAFSPDGKTVYYDGQVGEDIRLYAVDVDSGETRELTHTTGWDLAPVPDPSGRRVAFIRSAGDPMAVFVADLDALDRPTLVARSTLRPVWSPDGRHVWAGRRDGVHRFDPDTKEISRTITPLDDRIPLMGVELSDGGFVLLTNPGDGSAIADGVMFFPADGSPGRWLTRAMLEEVLTLTSDEKAVIVAKVTMTRSIELWRVPLDGGVPTQLPGNEIVARKKLSTTADGLRLVWSDCLERTRLSVISTDGSQRLTDLAGGDWSDAEPTAVPGTRDILFLSDRADGLRVWTMDRAAAGPVRRVPFGDIQPVRLAVSASGGLLAASGNRTTTGVSQAGLFVAPLDGSRAPVRLVDIEGELDPAFDRPGRRIYFTGQDDGKPRIASVSVDGGETTWELPPNTFAAAPSPVADVLAYLAADDRGRTPMLLDMASGQSRPIGADLLGPWERLRWSADGLRLLLVSRPNSIVEIDARTGRVVRELSTGADGISGAAYVGDDIVVGRTSWNGDLWTARIDEPLR